MWYSLALQGVRQTCKVADALAACSKVERLPDAQVGDVDVMLLHVGRRAVHHKVAQLMAVVCHTPIYLQDFLITHTGTDTGTQILNVWCFGFLVRCLELKGFLVSYTCRFELDGSRPPRAWSRVDFPEAGGPSSRVMRRGRSTPLTLSRICR